MSDTSLQEGQSSKRREFSPVRTIEDLRTSKTSRKTQSSKRKKDFGFWNREEKQSSRIYLFVKNEIISIELDGTNHVSPFLFRLNSSWLFLSLIRFLNTEDNEKNSLKLRMSYILTNLHFGKEFWTSRSLQHEFTESQTGEESLRHKIINFIFRTESKLLHT